MTFLTSAYVEWNRLLLQYCEQSCADEDGRFTLGVQEMLTEGPAEHEGQYISDVAEAYRLARIYNKADVLKCFLGTDDAGFPLCGAMLGITVLAAERMSKNAFYAPLRHLLGQRHIPGVVPDGFVAQTFEEAWLEALQKWLTSRGLRLETPPGEQLRYIRLPKMHALLRACDVQKLPLFFQRYRYYPDQKIDYATIEAHMQEWISMERSRFTSQGLSAWNDDVRRPGITRQAQRILSQWDGVSTEFQRENAVRRTQARLHLDMPNGVTRLCFRIKRPTTFPPHIRFGNKSISASNDDHYYNDVPITKIGECSLNGFNNLTQGKFRAVFRIMDCFTLLPSEEGSGYDQAEGLVLGAQSVVICKSSRAVEVEHHLQRISKTTPPIAKPLSDHPGWHIFGPFQAEMTATPPLGLEVLCVSSRLLLQFQGGLRLGRAAEWLHGKPPHSLTITGVGQEKAEAFVDGYSCPISDGMLPLSKLLQSPGVHEVRVNAERRLIRIVVAQVANQYHSRIRMAEFDAIREHSVSPTRTCIVLGAIPGQIALGCHKPYFQPVWSIIQDAQGYGVVQETVASSPREGIAKESTWEEAVLRHAHCRVGTPSERREDPAVAKQAWLRYVHLALEIKASKRCSRGQSRA